MTIARPTVSTVGQRGMVDGGSSYVRGVLVSVRKQYLPWLVCAVMFVVGVPALASGEGPARPPADAAFDVHDNSFDDAAGGPGDHTVTIPTGGTVTFTYANVAGNNA